ERAAAVDQRDDGQAIVPGDALRPDMLFRRHAEIGAALDGRVIGDDHDMAAGDDADAGDDPGAGRHILIFAKAGQLAKFKKGSAGIDQLLDPLARQHLALLGMTGADLLRPADALRATERVKLRYSLAIMGVIFSELFRRGIEGRF